MIHYQSGRGWFDHLEESAGGFLPHPGRHRAGTEFYPRTAPEDRRIIGSDIATVEFGWPIGKPTCAPMGLGLWEVRSDLNGKRIARVLFTLHKGEMVLLHGFVKKTQKTPKGDLDLARKRLKEVVR
jgi:phage-related protein